MRLFDRLAVVFRKFSALAFARHSNHLALDAWTPRPALAPRSEKGLGGDGSQVQHSSIVHLEEEADVNIARSVNLAVVCAAFAFVGAVLVGAF